MSHNILKRLILSQSSFVLLLLEIISTVLGSRVNLKAICVKLWSALGLKKLILSTGMHAASRCHCCVRVYSNAAASEWSQWQAICVFGCVCACRQQSGLFPWNSIISSKADIVKAATEYRILQILVCLCICECFIHSRVKEKVTDKKENNQRKGRCLY